MLFTTLCTGWILKKHTRKLFFAQQRQKPQIGGEIPINPPSLPLEGPYLPLRKAQFAGRRGFMLGEGDSCWEKGIHAGEKKLEVSRLPRASPVPGLPAAVAMEGEPATPLF